MIASTLANTTAPNVNVIQFGERGHGQVNRMTQELTDAGAIVSYLDTSVIDATYFYLPIWDAETKTVVHQVPDHILKCDALILDEVEGASDEVLEAIGTLMDNRTLGGVEVPALKTVIVFLEKDSEKSKNIAEALRILGQTAVMDA